MSRATEDLLDSLHGELAETMRDTLRAFKEKGEPVPASYLAQVIRFLKDNGIDVPGNKNKGISGIMGELPDFDEADARSDLTH